MRDHLLPARKTPSPERPLHEERFGLLMRYMEARAAPPPQELSPEHLADRIQRIEESLGAPLPASYREFLRSTGGRGLLHKVTGSLFYSIDRIEHRLADIAIPRILHTSEGEVRVLAIGEHSDNHLLLDVSERSEEQVWQVPRDSAGKTPASEQHLSKHGAAAVKFPALFLTLFAAVEKSWHDDKAWTYIGW